MLIHSIPSFHNTNMPAQNIDGKLLAEQIMLETRKEIVQLGYTPGLAVFLVGDDEASRLYVKLKEKACQKVGIDFHKYLLPADTTPADLIEAIKFLDGDEHVDAILVQLPLPTGHDTQTVINAIAPTKDVDGFHPETIKQFLAEPTSFVPGLSLGIVRLVESTKVDLQGKKAVILANSDIFSAPLKKLLELRGLNVQTVSAKTDGIDAITSQADVLIVAVGKPGFVNADMVKAGAIVIDVGTTKTEEAVQGDVDFDSVVEKAGYITPVPGGVGPMTVAMLLENTLRLAKKHRK